MAHTRLFITLLAASSAWAGCSQNPVTSHGSPDEDDIVDEDDVIDEDDDLPVEPFDGDGGARPIPVLDAGFRSISAPAKLGSLIVAEHSPPPISGGTLAVTSDGTLAVAADPDRDAVYVIQVAEERATTVTLPSGSEPGRTVLDDSGFAHVALRGADAIARISLASPEVSLQTKVCQHPRGVAYDASADAIWIACANGELVSLAAKTHAELTRTFVALDLRDVVITKSGERLVSRYRSAELLRIAADGSVAATTSPARTTGFSNTGVATSSPTLAWRTTSTVDGKIVMLHQQAQDDAVVIRPGGYGGGCQTITQPGITYYDDNGQPVQTAVYAGGGALAVDVAVSPDGQQLAIAAPGAYLRGDRGSVQLVPLAALQLASDGGVPLVIDAGTPTGTINKAAPVRDAAAPRVMLDAGSSSTAFPSDAGFPPGFIPSPCISAPWDGTELQATAVAFDGAGQLFAFSREPAQLTVYEAQPSANVGFNGLLRQREISLSERSVRDTGHELFHADVGSGLACASCHGEALDDGHVWTFEGFGPRRTQNMRGGLLSTLPLHWEGDMPSFKHLVDDVMTGRMGGFKVEPKYADALAGWIDAQPELTLAVKDAQARERGKALFESTTVACASCHSGPQLTNNKSANVGTGGTFQVPSLMGLGLRAPFMHDGCAKTLTERFGASCGGGEEHGKTAALSEAQIADLVSYLESL